MGSLVVDKFVAASARPTCRKSFARTLGTSLFVIVVLLVGMFTATFEVLGTMDRDIGEI